jgi:hypothetical protein
MSADAEIMVELRLLLDKLMGDARKAGGIVNKEMAAAMGNLGFGDKQKGEADQQEQKIKKVTRALRDQRQAAIDAWKATLSPPQVTNNTGPTSYPKAGPGRTIVMTGSGLATPAVLGGNQAPPLAPPILRTQPQQAAGNIFAQLAQMMKANNLYAGGAINAFGIGVAGRGGAGLAIAGIKATIEILRRSLMQLAETADKARLLYAKSLTTGGMPLGFTAMRQTLAGVIGVSEEDVLNYADAIKYLNHSLDQAIRITTQTTPGLAAMSYDFKVLEADLAALMAQVADTLSPIIRIFLDIVDTFVKAINTIGEAFKGLIKALLLMIGQLLKLGIMGAVSQTVGTILSQFLVGTLKKLENLPAPTVSSRRLEASPFERMGLVMGSTGNISQQIAKNTQDTARNTRLIYEAMHRGLSRGADSNPVFNVP